MKKFLALALALTMALSLAACGGSSSGSDSSNAADSSTDSSNTESGTTFEKQTWRYACSATENTCWADMAVTSARWSATLPAVPSPLRSMLPTS